MKLALAATAVALVLGTCLSFALHRYKFFGRSSLSFLIVLPIALPGIVTGVALRNTFIRLGWDLGFTTVVIGHGTFCIVLATTSSPGCVACRRTCRGLGRPRRERLADVPPRDVPPHPVRAAGRRTLLAFA